MKAKKILGYTVLSNIIPGFTLCCGIAPWATGSLIGWYLAGWIFNLAIAALCGTISFGFWCITD